MKPINYKEGSCNEVSLVHELYCHFILRKQLVCAKKDFSTYKDCEILNILRVGICSADNIHYACFSSIKGLSTVTEKVQAGSAGDCLVVARHAEEKTCRLVSFPLFQFHFYLS